MNRVALVEYDMPRILTVDFSQRSTDKIRDSGYEVKCASTGVLPQQKGEFSIPCSINDVEIVLFHLQPNSLNFKDRTKADDSVEEDPCFHALIKEVWNKGGVTVLFVKGEVNPEDLEYIGIENTGLFNINRQYFPSTYKGAIKKELGNNAPKLCYPQHKGNQLLIDENNKVGPIYKKYVHHAEHRIFSIGRDINIFGEGTLSSCQKWVVTDGSNINTGALCIEIDHYRGSGSKGRILIMPHFGDKTVDVALELIQDDIKPNEIYLFSKPNHDWLENYLPHPVETLSQRKEQFISEAIKKIEEFDESISHQRKQFSWMDRLLVSKDDEFAEAVYAALEFLGFTIMDMDKTITDAQRKREDFRIHDTEYFALVEAKSTLRGANEKMIQDLQTHINRYMREFKTTDVPGLLIVNHSCKLAPENRHDFYKGGDIRDRLTDNYITAIDSVFLHSLCQQVLSEKTTMEEARLIIESYGPVLSQHDLAELDKK